MDAHILPAPLSGRILVPSSKSMTHRELICAALAEGESLVENVSPSKDIEATVGAMTALGAAFEEIPAEGGRTAYRVRGGLKNIGAARCDCGESGSTLRFLIPIGLLSGNTVTYEGHGRLGERPLTPYHAIFDARGISYSTKAGLPLTVSGTLTPGTYELPGDVSSQFFTGLLFVLPLLAGSSVLRSTTKLESESYIAMTTDCMARHGVEVRNPVHGEYKIRGGQAYRAGHFSVEGDYSQAAFWLAAGAAGGGILAAGLSETSTQGDRAIETILRRMGAALTRNAEGLAAAPSATRGTVIDAEDCPDLVPVLAALAAVSAGETRIVNAARVRLKECDRLHAMTVELTKLGADIRETPDSLIIQGKETLTGGQCDAWNDHRIAMALAAVSAKCTGPLTISGAESVAKSYPRFWEDFAALGGNKRLRG